MKETPTPEHLSGSDGAAGGQPFGSIEDPVAQSSPPPTTSPDRSFGVSLEPVLRKACGGRLGEVNWFRTDWQRGGALTGYAVFQDNDGIGRPAVVKLPLPPVERLWLTRLQGCDDVVPIVYAHGELLNGYDMAWIVMERVPHGPLGPAWGGCEFDLLVEAAGRFYAAAAEFPVKQPPPTRDWQALLDRARENVHRHSLPEEQRWNQALKKARRKLSQWVSIWDDRRVDQWCHGDLHPGNAMTRQPPTAGPAVLLDFALTRPGNWVEDAVYFEHLFWAHRDRLGGRRLCRQIAHERKRFGLEVDKEWSRLARVERVLLAMSTPAMLHLDGRPRHIEAALAVLEAEVGSR